MGGGFSVNEPTISFSIREDKEKEIFFGTSNHVLNNQLRLCNEDEIKMIKRLLENEYLWLRTNYNICYGIIENI